MRNDLIVIAGATATGKTALAVRLAQTFGGEVVSADSMQIYKYMNVGTAKPTFEEMGGIRHHLIDELYPDEEFNASIFVDMARERIEGIRKRGNVPIVAGGTGFYLNALIKGTAFGASPQSDDMRSELRAFAEREGNEALHDRLKAADPAAAAEIHFNNVKRVIRALEFHALTGEKISAHNILEKSRGMYYNTFMAMLELPRPELYERIDRRVDKMVDAGLFEEVDGLLKRGYTQNLVSMQGLGYKEAARFFSGQCSRDEAVADIKRGTRRFAKRQTTWFNNKSAAFSPERFDVRDGEAAHEAIIKRVNDFINGRV